MARATSVDFTVKVCSVCGGTLFNRYGTCVEEPNDPIATEFADCLICGESYLYKRPAPPPREGETDG